MPICHSPCIWHTELGCIAFPRIIRLQMICSREVFRSVNSSKDHVIAAGDKAMTIVQKGKLNDHLDTTMYPRFQELVTTRKKAIHPNMLPSTSAATKYHSLRVFHQVQQWQRNTIRCRLKIGDGNFLKED